MISVIVFLSDLLNPTNIMKKMVDNGQAKITTKAVDIFVVKHK